MSVSIQNSPGVPDLGGHCIICGLVRGNLTAVEPNLVICITPILTSVGNRGCTAICPPGHDCEKPLVNGIVELTGKQPAVRVEVLDNDKEGKVQQLNKDIELDATKCTTSQPCIEQTSDGTQMSVSFEFGPVRCEGLTTVTGAPPPTTSKAPSLPANWPPAASDTTYTLSHQATNNTARDQDQGLPAMDPTKSADEQNPWTERFTLSKPTPRGGFVVQRIYVSVTGQQSLLFWEVFEIKANSSYSDADTWKANSMALGCQGSMGVVAVATYYDGMTEAWVNEHFSKGGADSPVDSDVSWYTYDAGIVSQLATTLFRPTNAVNRFWTMDYNYGEVIPLPKR